MNFLINETTKQGQIFGNGLTVNPMFAVAWRSQAANEGRSPLAVCRLRALHSQRINKTQGAWLMEYKINDLVLPILKLPEPCPVKVIIDEKYVRLFVGQRDWQWRIEDGSLVGSGAGCICEIPEEKK